VPLVALQTSPTQPAPVRQIATLLAGWIDRLGAVWVEGQITQLNRRPGLAFLTLRDPLGDISMTVTCPRQVIDATDPPVVEGAGVVVHGRPRYYPNRGSLSLVADEIRMVGLGELLARLERRRQLLAAEGLFARDLKRPPPFLPRRVGLVTARDSAAERDVLDNARRRWPGVDIVVEHASMQGASCVREVVEALERLDRSVHVDVIVIARGGGSVEDLLPFSDETLVRAVAGVSTPVISAIGHEPDTPLLDLVADVRASTPTDAAKIAVPDVAEELHRIRQLRDRARRRVTTWLQHERAQLGSVRQRPVLADPRTHVAARHDEVDDLVTRAFRVVGHRIERADDDLRHARARVHALSPVETLRRGYSVLQTEDGTVVTTLGEVSPGLRLSARVVDGRIDVDVVSTSSLQRPQEASDDGPDD
jgi:exodeoxyribonuclease VII large subunit